MGKWGELLDSHNDCVVTLELITLVLEIVEKLPIAENDMLDLVSRQHRSGNLVINWGEFSAFLNFLQLGACWFALQQLLRVEQY